MTDNERENAIYEELADMRKKHDAEAAPLLAELTEIRTRRNNPLNDFED